MISEAIIDQTVKELFDNIYFGSEPKRLYEPLSYMISIGGKRIRPRLCLIAYSLFKDNIGGEILDPAKALEVFHTFTLIHDDIMDHSPLRRGMPTVWKKWNEDIAILSGDEMNIESYRLMAKAPAECLGEILALFSKTASEVCEGQQYDMDFEAIPQVSMDEYMKMIGLKTAVLLACSAKVGAMVAGASSHEADLLYQYGYQLGLAFQVADDYLDAYGDEKVFGKPIGGDIVNNKKCWLTNRALDKCKDREELLSALALPADTDEMKKNKISAVKSIYEKLGVDKDAREEVSRLTEKAMEAASALDVSPVRIEMLKRFADSLVNRAK